MVSDNVHDALENITQQTGVHVSVRGLELLVNGTPVPLPIGKERGTRRPIFELTGEKAELFGLHGIFPTVPRGDDRDKLLWQVLAGAGRAEGDPRLPDRQLARDLAARLKLGTEASKAASLALAERFFNDKREPALLPVHSSLPVNYAHTYWSERRRRFVPSGYRMFNGGILPYLLWDPDSNAVDVEPVHQLIDIVSDRSQLTSLDKLFLQIAMEDAPAPDAELAAQTLVQEYGSGIAEEIEAAGGQFCPSSIALFRRDIRTVLSTPLPRPERVQWMTLLLSLHLSVRMYRVAVVKGGELDLAVAAAADIEPPKRARGCACTGDPEELRECPLAGLIRFRTGSGRYRPVSGRDACRSSYVELGRRKLLDMPATLVTRFLAARAWQALGGGLAAQRLDMAALAVELRKDAELRRTHNATCAALAILHHDVWRKGNATLEELDHAARSGPLRPGLHALREEVRRSRRRDLRHQSTDVVNQLMQAANVGPGSLLARNGRSFDFYEIDESLLLLLVRLVCGSRQIPLEAFLDGLLAYGLAPQDDRERDALADTLERLGLLARYSDAGEASFVHYA